MIELIILILFVILSSGSGAIGYYFYNQPKKETSKDKSSGTPSGTSMTPSPKQQIQLQNPVQTCTTKNQSDNNCRTWWDCILDNGTTLSTESINWGHTADDATWACNSWKDKCNNKCTAKFRSDITLNPPEIVQTCTITNQPDGKCRTWWNCKNGTFTTAVIPITSGHTQSDASQECNNFTNLCAGKCTAEFNKDVTTKSLPGGTFSFKHKKTGKCIHPNGGKDNPDNNTNAVFWDGCDNNKNRFQWLSNGAIKHVPSGKCLHPDGGTSNPNNGTNVVFYDDCTSGTNIQYNLLPDGTIRHYSGKCLHPEGGTANNGTNLVFWDDCYNTDKLSFQLNSL